MVDHLIPDLLVDGQALLGELPRWSVARDRLLWMDVDSGALCETDPATGATRRHDVGLGIGAVAPRSDGGVALARRDCFLLADLDGAAAEPLAAIPSAADEIMNDGMCDPAGRFWAGSYAEGERPGGGRLYRLDRDGRVRTMLEGVTLSNGLGWSPDQRLMYYVDSMARSIDVFDFDAGDGAIANRRRWVAIPERDGLPDGLAVDAEGAVWIALWGGRAVRRYTPAGELDRVVDLPTDHVTACAFGGADGNTLFITTAAGYLDAAARGSQPHAGGLFALAPGVCGPPPTPFAP